MRVTRLALLLSALPSLAAAQAIVVSPKPDKVAVTVYRDPYGGGAMDLRWLNGFAMVSETRRVSLPAGESELRFEGVAGGLVPQSATVSLPDGAVIEKNRDAKLLSPGTLLDASLGKRVHLRRTSNATGAVRELDAIVRASGDGVVIETEGGIEALRCTGLSETLLPPEVPATLASKPTLSVRVRSERPVAANVVLTYLSSGFDWRAHYVATLAPDERSLELFAWLTLANGDETSFADAETMAVAGRLNREATEILEPEMRPIALSCWPSQRTHEISESFDLAGSVTVEGLMAPPPAPPPPPAAPERDEIVVTGSRMIAQREDLGDLKLYRVPIPVTVASNAQKQVALIEQPRVKVESLYRWRSGLSAEMDEPAAASRIVRMQNRKAEGLGLPLPAGSFTLYADRDGQPFLIGEGSMTDRAEGEKVEVPIDQAPGVRVRQTTLSRAGKDREGELVVTNDLAHAVPFEARFDDDRQVVNSTGKLVRREGAWWWTVTVPANGSRTLRYRYRDPG
jgi:hypothetical protein